MTTTASQIVEVPFDGDVVAAVQHGDDVSIVVKRVCEALGVDPDSQYRRLKGSAWATTVMMTVVDPSGRRRPTLCIPLKRFPMWLATFDASRVAEHVRPKIVRYQVEAADVLHAYFFGRIGHLGARSDPQLIEHVRALEDRVASLQHELAVLTTGTISAAAWGHMRRLVKQIVDLEMTARRHLTRKAAFWNVYWELRQQIPWGDTGQPWGRLPVRHVQDMFVVLERRKAAAQRQLDVLAAERQLPMPWASTNGPRVLS